jgi:hypothetical protein
LFVHVGSESLRFASTEIGLAGDNDWPHGALAFLSSTGRRERKERHGTSDRALRLYFREEELCHEDRDDEQTFTRWSIGGNNGSYEAFATDLPTGHLWLYVQAPIRIPEHLRPRAALLLAWVNHGLRWGSFELDPQHGELRHCAGSLVPEGDPGLRVVADLHRQACGMMDEFLPLLVEGTFSSDPVDVTYRRLFSAMTDGEPAEPRADVSEVLEAIGELGREESGKTA